MKKAAFLVIGFLCLSSASFAQFTGPVASGQASTVEAARKAPVDTYVTVTGNILAHLREDYYTFRDETGEVRVEIEPPVWRNRKVGPDTKVRLIAEVDRNAAGTIYLWVESLEIAE
ncbi:NirD/YgiW/YdeI family stress tolerance protein [Thiorhodovibrio frisius]|uniref:Uncharacterized protein n=1 Tax=Thiorhodovibrio frisius TaxID=631362 RepID=H8Z6I2_9GAMM|nr:NirD/YgiW/YdeI family stress tolerance protein [Thiorhodovibrio frisius]EIC19680.1 hypothetical protein Thi970DRAFT_03272 [Thiorhodovibrio frisius]WPL20352.1 hypothetical protein Thiofri_00439 [Thiorhodovibrio frisius]